MTSKWSSLSRASVALVAASFLCFGSVRAAEKARETTEHILRSDSLTVRVMDPDNPERYNRGPRFSPLAAVLQVSLDGREFLHCPESHDPLREGAGLFGEFDILSEGGPPGFREARIGEGFVKIGVGVLEKEGENYDFFAQAKVLERAATTVEWSDSRASFRQTCRGINGYRYSLEADIVVNGSQLTLRWNLSNQGAKAFGTEHYVHNFFSFDRKPVGPGYQVRFSQPIAPILEHGSDREGVTWTDREISFEATIKNHVNILLNKGEEGGAMIKTSQRENGQEIAVDSSAPVARTFIHATSRYLCPEQFVRISLKPGESYVWSRTYDFSIRKNRE